MTEPPARPPAPRHAAPPAIAERPSPNCDARPADTPVDLVVLHYTGMESAAAALERLCDPAAKVSAHYLIDEDGATIRLVPEARRAWHAGVSHWAGADGVNGRSIGIELVNPGHEFGYRAFPEPQMAALEALLAAIVARYRLPPDRVVGHSDVAPARKQDPGELFDWPRLAARGLALPAPAAAPPSPPEGFEPRAALAEIGYDPACDEAAVVTAFQRRFLPRHLSGVLDAETAAAIAAVLADVRRVRQGRQQGRG